MTDHWIETGGKFINLAHVCAVDFVKDSEGAEVAFLLGRRAAGECKDAFAVPVGGEGTTLLLSVRGDGVQELRKLLRSCLHRPNLGCIFSGSREQEG